MTGRIVNDQLKFVRDYVSAELATLPKPPCDWTKFHAQVDLLKARLISRVQARFFDRSAGSVEVQLCGLRASSTMGASAALSAWLRKADRFLSMENAHG